MRNLILERDFKKYNYVLSKALPYTKTHVKVTKTVERTLKFLEIIIIWCDGVDVSIDGRSKVLEQLKYAPLQV